MYINLETWQKSNLELGDLELLVALKQNSAGKCLEFLNKYLSEVHYSRFKELDLIKEVKAKNKQETLYSRLRLSDKGSKMLISFSFGGGIDEETKILHDWLFKIYKQKENGIVRNRTECQRRLQWFKEITAISGNKLATLIGSYVSDSFIPENQNNFHQEFKEFKNNNPRATLSNCLDNICWKAPNDRAVNYTLGDSPLWDYYIDNEAYIKQMWKDKNLEDE